MRRRFGKLASTAMAVALAASLCGCSKPENERSKGLAAEIDRALATLRDGIRIDTNNHPWEVMHGIYLFGPEFEIHDVKKGKKVNALNNICCMDTAREFIQSDELGPMFVSKVGEAEADTHRNMFLSILADADVPLHHQFHSFDGNVYPLWRFLDKATLEIDIDAFRASPDVEEGNYGNETGWTLSAFSKFFPLDYRWKNEKGQWVDTGNILSAAAERPLGWGTCFGTHELYGIAAAVTRRETDGVQLAGAWEDGRAYLNEAIARARKFQNEDGSFSKKWFEEKKKETTPKLRIYATGHMIEWLTLALPEDELKSGWIENAVKSLARDVAENFDDIKNSYSISTHAGHALRAYKKKAL